MLYWLLNLGFDIESIEKYARNKNYGLKELINNTNIQIEDVIKHQILFDLYKN